MEPEPHLSGSQPGLLERALRGSRSAVEALFGRHAPWLQNWSRGRMPRRVCGVLDTSDVVQDALHHTFARFPRLEPKHAGAFRAYLRQSVDNRIRDELRRATRSRDLTELEVRVVASDDAAPQHRQVVDEETWARYRAGLDALTAREHRLIVGRADLGYSYKQIALIEGQRSPDAARMALRRALQRLSQLMPHA